MPGEVLTRQRLNRASLSSVCAITAGWLSEGGHFVFATPYGPLDALSWVAGLNFPSLDARALDARLADGTTLRICEYDDLVAMKRMAGRPRDEADLRELRSARE